ncbi:MAG TPA: family 10 glycosylhydrolase [Acholeplasmataceae bacterium]|nr:family 10 glycosylhydrolase [Acholeplasmataceae bacterium]
MTILNKIINRKVLFALLVTILGLTIVACKKTPVEDDVVSLVEFKGISLSIDGEVNDDFEEKEYYLDRQNDYQINVFLENELDLQIIGLKISNIYYLDTDFTYDKVNGVVMIQKNTENNIGIHDIVLEEIVYENDNDLESNLPTENNKIKLFVKARFTPVIRLLEKEELSNKAVLLFEVTDRDRLIDFSVSPVELFVYDENSNLVYEQTLGLYENEIIIEGLKIDHNFTFEVKASYDVYDGSGFLEHVAIQGDFSTKPPIDITFAIEEEHEINYNYLITAENITLDKITLTLDETLITDVQLDATKITDLESGTYYDLNFYYSYVHDDLTIENVFTIPANTFELIYTDVIRSGSTVPHWQGGNVKIPNYRRQEEELRAVWISTVSNIDIARMQPGEAGKQLYKDTIKLMLDNVKAMNMNAVFFQIRPMNDAFYRSELAPWSRYITGEEGANPGFDILEFALEEAHLRGIELHAWLNPYRVATSETMLQGMTPTNFAFRNPDLLMQATNSSGALNTILDPGEPEVQTYITDVISEIMENYPTINGIHFDDYFYLDTSMIGANSESPDYETYLEYREYPEQTIEEFRRNSVTKTIRAIYEDVEAFNTTNDTFIKFGISPSGIWDNIGSNPEGSHTTGWSHLRALNADTKHWIEEGIIHYIIPQIYWDFNTSAARYANLVDWWSNVVEGTSVYLLIGMGPYRYRDNSPWRNSQSLPEQLRYNQSSDQVSGQVFFTYRDIAATSPQPLVDAITFIRENYWTSPANLPWESNVE